MDTTRRTTLIADLTNEDPEHRGAALKFLGAADVADPEVFAAALTILRDERPVPDRFRPPVPVDPFAEFFGMRPEPPPYPFSTFALERLTELLPPGTPEILSALKASLTAPIPKDAATLAARLLGAVRWDDEVAAVKALVPPLLAGDHTLFEALPGLSTPGLRAITKLALRPFHARAANELLNHPSAGDTCAQAICAGLVKGEINPSEAEALEILPLIATWGRNDGVAAAGAASALEAKYPWAVAFAAFDNTDAQRRLREFMATNQPFPELLLPKLRTALAERGRVEGFPLAEWMSWADGDPGVAEIWNAGTECRAPLEDNVRRFLPEDRGWEAAAVLLKAGAHEGVADLLAQRLAEAPVGGGLWDRLVTANPPVAGASDFVIGAALGTLGDLGIWRPTLEKLDADGLARFVDTAMGLAEKAPLERTPAPRAGFIVRREGIDTKNLKSLVALTGSEARAARMDALLPRRE